MNDLLSKLKDYLPLIGVILGSLITFISQSLLYNYQTKIKFIADKLYTEKAKEIGKERTEYFRAFLDRLEKEIFAKI